LQSETNRERKFRLNTDKTKTNMDLNKNMKALLVLEDGFCLEGRSFTGQGETVGEVVFNTAMTGYQEVLTDPSYRGQIINMTYPLIGNYGVNPDDVESDRVQVAGFVIKELSPLVSNWRAESDLASYLKANGVMGIEGVDTRALTKHIRSLGDMKGVISTLDDDPELLRKKAASWAGMVGLDTIREVTTAQPYGWPDLKPQSKFESKDRFKVLVMDYGAKYNILRKLHERNCEVIVLPADFNRATIDRFNPDGIMLSNGPGDPAGAPYAVETARDLIGRYPIFGICMGHQILGQAIGGKTFKLKFGHRGANQPVKDLTTGKIEITSQNHGFCVDLAGVESGDVELTHVNLNDNTLEGFRHRSLPMFAVQYHPEASPGPHDAAYLFDRFIDMIKEAKA